MRFADRREAGRQLGRRLQALPLERPVVLALPRGGVPVGFEIALALRAPLGLVLVRKIGVPGQLELAAGAAVDTEPPQVIWNERVIRSCRIDEATLAAGRERALAEIVRRRERYAAGPSRPSPAGRTVVLVDDGIATGATMRAALLGLKRAGAASIVLAVPVASPEALDALSGEVDRVVCVHPDPDLAAVGAYYDDFAQVTDAEVADLLARATGGAGR